MKKRMMHKRGLAFKLLIPVGIVLFLSIFIWSKVTINLQEKALLDKAVSDVDKFCNSVLNFTWFAMLHSPNKDLPDVLKSMSEYNEIEGIRLFDAHGKIKFSNNSNEIHTIVEKTDVACKICHFDQHPVMKLDVNERIRIFKSPDGEPLLGIINPILNETGCSSAECHYHPAGLKKIGSLDVIVSLKSITTAISLTEKVSGWTAVYLFIVLGITICFCAFKLVTNPIQKLIKETDLIGKGIYKNDNYLITRHDEIGQLSLAIQDMGKKIKTKQDELNEQRHRYQNLFDQVPCTITVQNLDYQLLEFNKEFSKKFNPDYGDFCYSAYKKLDKKCNNCPVERTFMDGRSHFSEESGINKDGSIAHWFVKTAPLKDENGNIVAAMEMTIDISRRKKLEEIVKESERKYQAIFKNIPNPVFILDKDDFTIKDCNDSALSAYGYDRRELIDQSLDVLFSDTIEFEKIKKNMNRVYYERIVNIKKDQSCLFVNIWISPARFVNTDVWIMTIVDISISVETEQQLIQAGKMATLGEMATGVAHELNQPLSVIKTASSFISKKLSNKTRSIDPDILKTLSDEIESHVDRAAKITNHMRLFGRKSVFKKEEVNINEVLTHAFDVRWTHHLLRQSYLLRQWHPWH